MSDTSQQILIRAAEGRRVRHPVTLQILPPDGIQVDASDPFWYRRWAVGDIEVINQLTHAPQPHPGSIEIETP